MRFGYPDIKLAFWILFLWAFVALAHCQPITIDCGAPADTGFSGGTAWSQPDMGAGVLSTLRYGPRFSYRVPAPAGVYTLRFLFVEPNATAIGQRRFTITVNGQTSDPIDVFKDAGPRPMGSVLETTALSYFGFIKIDFTGLTGNAIVNAIEVLPALAAPAISQMVASSFECLTATPTSSCVGMRAATFKRPDGTETPPFVLVPGVDVDLADAAKWKPAPIL